MTKKIALLIILVYLVVPAYCFAAVKNVKKNVAPTKETAMVHYVTDGDTVRVKIKGQNYIVRLIGVDTPEIKDPRKAVQCFGQQASDYTKKMLLNQTVTLESDPVAGNKDMYGRLLRYVFLENGTNYNRKLIADGYAYEYTYQSRLYRYRDDFKQAQKDARENKLGLWADSACAGLTSPITAKNIVPATSIPPDTKTISLPNLPAPSCVIKGNISAKEKIYHLPGCRSYSQTIINENAGEKWFCSEQEAVKSGFRKAKNCG